MPQGNRIKEKIAKSNLCFSTKQSSGLFVGYGRTGEIPVGVTKLNNSQNLNYWCPNYGCFSFVFSNDLLHLCFGHEMSFCFNFWNVLFKSSLFEPMMYKFFCRGLHICLGSDILNKYGAFLHYKSQRIFWASQQSLFRFCIYICIVLYFSYT